MVYERRYNQNFKVMIIRRQTTGKPYSIELYLWLTNRESYMFDLERPLPAVSRSRHSLTLNISETA